jgi:hypothetical protein
LGLGLKQLHDRLTPPIEAHDGERAAEAFEQTPGGVLAELQRHFPGIPSADDLRRPDRGIECAKDLLGCCVSGADIVPGRRRGLVTVTIDEPEGARSHQVSCCDGLLPARRRFGSEGPQRGPGDKVALKIERVVDGGMDTEEALGGSS